MEMSCMKIVAAFLAEDALDNAYRRLDGSNDEYVRYNIDPHWTYVKENGDNHMSVEISQCDTITI